MHVCMCVYARRRACVRVSEDTYKILATSTTFLFTIRDSER